MRNLKKILALVLALMMAVSLMVTASAAAVAGTSYADDATIKTYDEAVQVLTQLGVYRGQGTGNFAAGTTITRAEVAALIYRIVHQDVTDKYVGIYADYNEFADVNGASWYAGYVNYCANGEFIVGDGTNFYPMNNVTGYEVLAIMLRALGYDREGEFQGTGWKIRTARAAKELGITANVDEGTLGAPATRELVAELIFQALLCDIQNYSNHDGYISTKATLGYRNFGLSGEKSMYYRELAVADGIYEEPIAYWYGAAIDGDGEIEIRFNPKATYSTAVADDVLFAAAGVSGTSKVTYSYAEDGAALGNITLNKAATASSLTVGGKGVETILFNADGRIFVVEKNTYVDYAKVAAHAGKGHNDLTLSSGKSIDYALAGLCTTTTINNGAVVIYNMYEANGTLIADFESIHLAPQAYASVTNTYDTGSAKTSYFVGSGKTYEYNDIYADSVVGNNIPQMILNRDENSYDVGLMAYPYGFDYTYAALAYDKFDANQMVFTDDFGYVVHVYDVPAAAASYGWMVVTEADLYGDGKLANNQYVITFDGYSSTGAAMTNIKGAVYEGGYAEFMDDYMTYLATLPTNPNAVAPSMPYYTTASAASAVVGHIEPGLYYYTVDAATGCYTMVEMPAVMTEANNGTMWTNIAAGDADAIWGGAAGILDDETVFVIANYNANGIDTGEETVVTNGFKNIKNLVNSNTAKTDYTVWALNIDGDICYDVNNTPEDATDDVGTYDIVFVVGADQKSQTAGDASSMMDKVFYLAGQYSEDFVVTYDTHKVVFQGQNGGMKFVPHLITTQAAGKPVPVYSAGLFYKITGTTDTYVSSIQEVATATIDYVAPGVIAIDGVCATLAANCVVYGIDGGVVATMDIADVAGLEGVVVATDAYGYITALYVVE